MGYGKAGSFEGFCSGGGIAELGRSLALEQLQRGKAPAFCPTLQDLGSVTALSIAQAAQEGDPTALEVYRCSGRHLGMALALLCDLLNPQRVVIGSIYQRSQALLRDAAMEVLTREALPGNAASCQVVPAVLGEQLGDTAALSVAVNGLGRQASHIEFAL